MRSPAPYRVTAGGVAIAVALAASPTALTAQEPPELAPASTSIPSVSLDEVPIARAPSTLEVLLDHLTVFGDMRLRQEENRLRNGRLDRHRTRARIRFGLNYAVREDTMLGLRFATGDREDPRSSHVTFGDDFEGLEFSLDRAFLNFRPNGLQGLELTAGKFAHAFESNPVYRELVWDDDVQPEGFMVEFVHDHEGLLERSSLRAGHYLILESANNEGCGLSVLEAAATLRAGSRLKLDFSTAAYLYQDPTPGGQQDLVAVGAGNALRDRDGDGIPDDFRSDFDILHATAAARSTLAERPLVVAVEAFRNLAARIGRDQGYAVGASWGDLREPGDWMLSYQWQVVGQDAVFAPLAQDDFLQTTGFHGHYAGVQVRLQEKLDLQLWALASRPERRSPPSSTGGPTEWRLRLDLNLRF